MKELNCPFCRNRLILVLDPDNHVYKCGNGHVWKVRCGKPIKLSKLSYIEAKIKLDLGRQQFVKDLNQLAKKGLMPPIRITDADLTPLREGLLALIAEGGVDVYVDQDYNINFILTGKTSQNEGNQKSNQ